MKYRGLLQRIRFQGWWLSIGRCCQSASRRCHLQRIRFCIRVKKVSSWPSWFCHKLMEKRRRCNAFCLEGWWCPKSKPMLLLNVCLTINFNKTYQHMLCQPSFPLGNGGADSQSETFLAQEWVTTISTAVRDDFIGCRFVQDNCAFRIARPAGHFHKSVGRCADRVKTFHKLVSFNELTQNGLAHSCHDSHRGDHVGWIGKFNADFWERRCQGSHGIGDDVHGATSHASSETFLDGGVHVSRGDPVAQGSLDALLGGWDGLGPFLGADKGFRFNASCVGGVGLGQPTVLVLGQRDDRALLLHQVQEMGVFVLGTVADVDLFGLAQVDVFLHVSPDFRGQIFDVAIDDADSPKLVEQSDIRMVLGEATDLVGIAVINNDQLLGVEGEKFDNLWDRRFELGQGLSGWGWSLGNQYASVWQDLADIPRLMLGFRVWK